MVPPEVIAHASALLQSIMATLSDTPDISRRGFLNIAEQMGNFSSVFATGASRATSIRERIESPDQFGLAPLRTDLRKIYREIGLSLESVTALLERKNSITRDFNDLIRWSIRLEQEIFLPSIVDQIHTKGGDMLEVQTLGSIVDNLMQQIRPLLHEVVTSSQEAVDALDHFTRRVRADLEASSHGQEVLRKATTNAQRRLNRAVEQITGACQTMEERSQSISRVVFDMVQAMQYDDITVQRVEHAVEALRRADTHLREDPSESGLRWFVVALRIVIDQLEESGADLVTSVQSIHHHLIRISDIAEEQATAISGLRSTTLHLRQDTTEVAFHLTSFLNLSIFNDNLASEVLRTLSRAENATFQTKRALNLLVLTSARLHTLSGSFHGHLNDRIDILATTIRELAARMQREAPQMIEAITRCQTVLEEMNDAFSQKTTPRLMRTNGLLRRAPFTTQQIDTNNGDVTDVMNHTLADTRAMAVQIMLLAAEMGFHMTIKRTLEQVVDDLQSILHRVGGEEALAMDRSSVQTLAMEFQDLMELYTMASERRVHQATLEGAPEEPDQDDGLDFELF